MSVHVPKLPLKVDLDQLPFLVHRRLMIGGADITRHPDRFNIVVNDAEITYANEAKIQFLVPDPTGMKFLRAYTYELVLPQFLAIEIYNSGQGTRPEFRDFIRKYYTV